MFEDLIECLKHMRTSCILTESKIKIYCVVIIWFVMNLRMCSILSSIFINSVITKNGSLLCFLFDWKVYWVNKVRSTTVV